MVSISPSFLQGTNKNGPKSCKWLFSQGLERLIEDAVVHRIGRTCNQVEAARERVNLLIQYKPNIVRKILKHHFLGHFADPPWNWGFDHRYGPVETALHNDSVVQHWPTHITAMPGKYLRTAPDLGDVSSLTDGYSASEYDEPLLPLKLTGMDDRSSLKCVKNLVDEWAGIEDKEFHTQPRLGPRAPEWAQRLTPITMTTRLSPTLGLTELRGGQQHTPEYTTWLVGLSTDLMSLKDFPPLVRWTCLGSTFSYWAPTSKPWRRKATRPPLEKVQNIRANLHRRAHDLQARENLPRSQRFLARRAEDRRREGPLARKGRFLLQQMADQEEEDDDLRNGTIAFQSDQAVKAPSQE